MSLGGRGRPDDGADGGGNARPRYLTLMAPSPPAPNGHRAGERRTAYGVPEGTRTRPERGLLLLVALAVAGVLLALAAALLAWVMWRLAVAGG